MNLLILFIALIASSNVRLTTADGMNCSLGFFFNGTSCDDCGLRSIQPNIRIVGGVVAIPNSWPAQALITQATQDMYGNVSLSRCGGTLINLNTILTAAHCFDYDTGNSTVESTITVFLSAHNVSFLDDGNLPPSVIVRNVAQLIPHEDYDPVNTLNDIALIILDSPVTLSPTVQVACLPEQSNNFPPENVTTYSAGWGKTNSSSDDLPTLLMNVNLTVYNPLLCENGSLNGTVVFVWDSQICAGKYEGGEDTCQGDSGGAIFFEKNINNINKDFVAGIVSYGYGCGLPQHPGIFTRTSYFINWIQNNMHDKTRNNASNTTNVTLPYSPPTTITTMRPQSPSRVCKYGTFDNGASCEVCGRKNGNATYPSTVAILVYDTTNSPNNTLLAICAGMLVNRETILSTKSCVINNTSLSNKLDSFAVFTTAENISLLYPNQSLDNSSPDNVVIKLKAVKKNPNSDEMALFILKNALPQTNQDVNIGCLPANTSFAPPVNKKCAERGVKILDNFKASLYSIDLKIIDCNNNSANSTNSTRLCAVKDAISSRLARDTSSSSCDSSGLLVVPDTVDGSSSFIVAGVTNGCQNGTTREFVSSASTVDWISSNAVVTDTTNTTNSSDVTSQVTATTSNTSSITSQVTTASGNTSNITSQVTTASGNTSNITSQNTTAPMVTAISNFTNITSIAITSAISNATVPLTTTPKGQCKYGAFYNGTACEVCGRSNSTSYPTVVVVAVFNATNTSNATLLAICVGMLVNRATILSTKDCVINTTNGSTNLDSYALISSTNNISLAYQNQTDNNADLIVIKLKLSRKDPNNNLIALFVLKTPISNNEDVNIGCLPSGRTYTPALNKKCLERGVRIIDNNTLVVYSIDLKISNCDNSSSNSTNGTASTLCAVKDTQTRSIRAIDTSCDSLGSLLLVSDTASDGGDSSVVAGVSNGCQSGTIRQFTSSASSVDWISANVVVSPTITTTTSRPFSMTIRNKPSLLISIILVVIGIFGFRNY